MYSGDVIISYYLFLTYLYDSNINGHRLFGAGGRSVVTTVSSGKVLMEDRKIIGLDEREIYAKARELSAKVWDRF